MTYQIIKTGRVDGGEAKEPNPVRPWEEPTSESPLKEASFTRHSNFLSAQRQDGEYIFEHGVGLAHPDVRKEFDDGLNARWARIDPTTRQVDTSRLLYTTERGIETVTAEMADLLRQFQHHTIRQVHELREQALKMEPNDELLAKHPKLPAHSRDLMKRFPVYTTPTGGGLGERIVSSWGGHLAPASWRFFPDREFEVAISDVRRKFPFIVASFCGMPDETMQHVTSLARAMDANRSKHPMLIAPFIARTRQDREEEKRTHVGPRCEGEQLAAAGIKDVITLELHTPQHSNMFGSNIRVQHIRASTILATAISDVVGYDPEVRNRVVFVSPDIGAMKGNTFYSKYFHNFAAVTPPAVLGGEKVAPSDPDDPMLVQIEEVFRKMGGQVAPLNPVDKRRDKHTGETTSELMRPIEPGSIVVIVDDLFATGGTARETARMVKEQGAAAVVLVGAHWLSYPGAAERVQGDPNVDFLITTDSTGQLEVPLYHPEFNPSGKFIGVSTAPLFAQIMINEACAEVGENIGSIKDLAKEIIIPGSNEFLYVNGREIPSLSKRLKSAN